MVKKIGNFDWENQTPSNMPKSKDQKTLEQEQRIKLLEKQKAFPEHLADRSDKKAIFFDMMIDMGEKEFNIPIRKTPHPSSQAIQNRTKINNSFYL